MVSRPGSVMFPNGNGAPFPKIHQNVLQNYCDLQRFQNTIPDLRKVEFRNGKTPFPASRYLRYETIMFSNENGSDFCKITKMHFETIMFYNVFRTQFPTYGKWSFPIGKVNKVGNRNCGLESFCFPMIPEHFLIKFEEKHIISIVFYNVFSTWIPTPQNPMNSNGFCTAAAAAAPAALPGGQAGPRADSGN